MSLRFMRVRATLGLSALLSVGLVAVSPGAGATTTVWDAMASCESGGRWSINSGNGYYGGLQFSSSTWRAFGGQAYAETADLATKNQQIYIAQQVLKGQGPGAWPTCSVRAGLTVENGLAVDVTPEAPSPPTTLVAGIVPLVVDGSFGPRSRKATEIWVGGSVDGSLSPSDVKKLQAKVGTVQDGLLGPMTRRALQRTVGAQVTGVWDTQTTRALQTHLNATLG